MSVSIRWTGDVQVKNNMAVYAAKVEFAVKQVAIYFAGVMEAYSKEHASWTDRTGLARQSLNAWVEELSTGIVRIYLSHGVYYGIFLEVRYAGLYSILWPTIQAHLEPIHKMLQSIFN